MILLIPIKPRIEEAKEKYRTGKIGDVECKKRLADILVALIEPISTRRKIFENDLGEVLNILHARCGTSQYNRL